MNGDSVSSLTTQPTCSTTATSHSSVAGSPYSSSCSGAADPNYTISYVSGSVTVKPARLTITASDGSMTYGGTPPTITAGYSGLVNGDTARLDPADLLDDRDSLELGAATYPSSLLGGGRPQLHDQLRERVSDGQAGPAHHHRLRRLDDLRRHTPGHHGRLQRLCERGQRPEPTTPPTCSTTATASSSAGYLSLFLLGGGGPELHDQLRERVSDGQAGPAHHHRLRRLDDLRRHTPGHHGRLRGICEQRLCLEPHHPADLLDRGHEPQLGRRVSLQFLLLGGRRPQLHDQLSDGFGDGEAGRSHDHRLERVDGIWRDPPTITAPALRVS